MNHKDVVLFINSINPATYGALRDYSRLAGRALQPVVIVDEKIRESIHRLNDQSHLDGTTMVVTADFDSPASIRDALKPFMDRIFAVTSQFENSIPELKKIVPFIPYLPMPTETSLDWATDKKLMREAFNAHDTSLSPGSFEVRDSSAQTVLRLEQELSYPMIVKPAGLERSLLIAVVNDRQELLATLSHTFKQLHTAYRKWLKRLEPAVLVEELMYGDMYSIDTYIAHDGTCRHAPPIKVVTGRKVGFEDFFSYLQLSSAGLSETELRKAYDATERACRSLGLRSVTAHTELMRTPDGWKIVEIGPRIGGYRQELYGLGYGMNHIVNDILNRAGEQPSVPRAASRHAAIFKTYAREEGVLDKIDGLELVRKLPSFVALKHPHKKGDLLRFARNNGDAVIEVTLCHDDHQQLQSDIQDLERFIHIRLESAEAPQRAAMAGSRH